VRGVNRVGEMEGKVRGEEKQDIESKLSVGIAI